MITQSSNLVPNNNRLTFKSRLNPIKPFIQNTKTGELKISEINYDTDITPEFIDKITDFFCENFSKYTTDNFWLRYRKGSAEEKKQHTQIFNKYYTKILRNEENHQDLTLLVAKDKYDKIQGVCLSYGCDEIPASKNNVLYIDSVAINDEYKNCGVARAMVEKTLNANKKRFTDTFLTSATMANKFYEKLGFKQFNPADNEQKTILDYIAKHRRDYPEHIMPYSKPLQEDKPRWFTNSAKAIKELPDN